MIDRQRLTGGIAPRVILCTYALGAAGGIVFTLLGLPLGMLLGSLVAVAAAASGGMRIFGDLPAVPQHWRFLLMPVIGVAIGAGFPDDFVQQAGRWWPSLAALIVFVPLAHALAWIIYRRVGAIAPLTAYFAAMPGGFLEALDMGERAGADMPMLIMLQFLRLILCIVFIPIAFAILSGHAVGSGAGAQWPGAEVAIEPRDAVILILAAILGWWGAHRLRFPAAVLTGPLLLSGLAHVGGLTAAAPPIWLILVTQWVVGTALGARFAGFQRSKLWLALGLAAVNVVVVLGIAALLALLLSGPIAEPVPALILAFAPGGITEMSLVALSLQMSAVYVTLHHLARIILAVIFARIGLRLLPVDPA
ncbi:MAG: putative ammonia monooxygenase [Rhodobacteraceae bacterium HLUCCA12]|nr:MAG: putative ammonia monooxygenase [Rhodobacteraceae bacterium HLUCCA12]